MQSYETVRSLSYSGPDNIFQRYAETVKQLACDRTQQQFALLSPLVPMLRDVIQQESNVEAVVDACFALQHLLDADDTATADTMIDCEVLPALVRRLDDEKVSISLHALETLKVFAECSTSEQVLEMEVAMAHLERFIVGSQGHRPNKKLTLEATLCLIPVCEGGEQSVQQILDQAPDLFPALMELVRTSTTGQSAVREIVENCTLALMHAVQSAGLNQLEYFLSLGMYPLTFRLLDVFADDVDIVKEALLALSSLLLKLPDAAQTQLEEEKSSQSQSQSQQQQGGKSSSSEKFSAATAWGTVRRVMEAAKAVAMSVEEDANSAYLEQAAFVADRAGKLLANAVSMGMAPPARK